MIVSVTDELGIGTVGSSSVGTVDCSIASMRLFSRHSRPLNRQLVGSFLYFLYGKNPSIRSGGTTPIALILLNFSLFFFLGDLENEVKATKI